MKQFNLEEYLKNPERKIVTRDGRKVTRFLCTDAKTEFPIVALIEVSPGSTDENLRTFTKDGRYFVEEDSCFDLFFAPEKHEGWVNIYRYLINNDPYCNNVIYASEEEARHKGSTACATVKIEWEE